MTVAQAMALLGVGTLATPKEIRRAYLRLVKKHKPERDPEGFQRVRAAYELLQDGIPAWARPGEEPEDADPFDTEAALEALREALAASGMGDVPVLEDEGEARARERTPVAPTLKALVEEEALEGLLEGHTGHPRDLLHRAAGAAREGRAAVAGRLAEATLDEIEYAMLGDELDFAAILVVACALAAEQRWDQAEALYSRARRLHEALYLRVAHPGVEGDRRVTGGMFALREHLPEPVLRACATAMMDGDWTPVQRRILEHLPSHEDREIAAFLLSEHAPVLFYRVAEVWPHVPRPRTVDSPWWVWLGAGAAALVVALVLMALIPLVLPSTWRVPRRPPIPDIFPSDELIAAEARRICQDSRQPGLPGAWRRRCADAARVQVLVNASRCAEAGRELADMRATHIESSDGVLVMSRVVGAEQEPPDDAVYRWAERQVHGCRRR